MISIDAIYKFSNFLKYNIFFLMNSSTGFKKRPLLRPPSGIREREKEYLRVFDISQAEPMIASQVKNQLMRIQDEINELDKDKKIRSSQGSSLQKSYVLTLKKWLQSCASCLQKQDDDFKIMKYMGVDSYQSGFRKLWKIISSLDHMITKITQLQIIQLLKYDQMFDQITKDSQKSALLLSTISKAGFTAGTFQVSQVLLDRSKDLYEQLLQSKKKGGFITTIEKPSSKQQTNELILQLQKENSKLSELLQELDKEKENNQKLMKELKSKEEIIKVNQNIANNATTKPIASTQSLTSTTPSQAFKQLQDRYTQRMSYLSQQISKLQSQLSEQKITISGLETRARLAQEDLKDKDLTKGLKPKAGSYQQALLQQMEKMKKGFQKKIQKIVEEAGSKEKEMRKRELDYKNENEKIKWEKNLLLKKFETLEQAKGK